MKKKKKRSDKMPMASHCPMASKLIERINREQPFAFPAWNATVFYMIHRGRLPDGTRQKGGFKFRVDARRFTGWVVVRILQDDDLRIEAGNLDDGGNWAPLIKLGSVPQDRLSSELVRILEKDPCPAKPETLSLT